MKRPLTREEREVLKAKVSKLRKKEYVRDLAIFQRSGMWGEKEAA